MVIRLAMIMFRSRGQGLERTSTSIVVRVQRRPFVVQKILRVQRRGDRLKRQRCLVEVEAIGEVIRRRIPVAERWQTEPRFHELQYAAEIMVMCSLRMLLRLRRRR